ncbi:MAG: hypothetical protein AB7W06_17445 [Alphaproteobacteria bacterium]
MADLVSAAEVSAAWSGFAAIAAGEQTALIAAVSAAAETFCRRVLSGGVLACTERLDGGNRPRVWLANRPVVAVTSVTVNGAAISNPNGDAWTFDGASGELLLGNGQCEPRFAPWFPSGRGNVVVVYTAGYAAVPDDVKRALIVWIKHIANALAADTSKQSETIGDYSYTNAPGAGIAIPALAEALLTPYRDTALA